MSLNFFKLVFLYILVGFFNFPTTEAEDFTFFPHYCPENTTNANNTFQVNVKTLISSLSSNATARTFYQDTISGKNASDAVYGLFMCRGDVPSQLCEQCVLNATRKLSSVCYLSKRAIIWGDKCMVRYSNSSFFSTVDLMPQYFELNTVNVSNQASFVPLLGRTLNETADEAAFSTTGDRFATKEANIAKNHTLYCLAQCTQDLSPQNCRSCLESAIAELSTCCEGKQRGRFLLPSCNIRYDLYPFYRVNATGQGEPLLPATKYSKTDSKYSQDPVYLSHNCTESMPEYLRPNLGTLLSYLSSNATGSGDNRFYKGEVEGRVFGLYMCRGDISPQLCGECVSNATDRIASECPTSSNAIVWYSHCLLRYSEHPFFNTMSTSPRFYELNVTNVNDVERSFKFTVLSNALEEVARGTGLSDESYLAKSFVLDDHQSVYVLGQCTRDLSSEDCSGCLHDVIGSTIPWSGLGSVGGRVLYPSCTLRFELFQFYKDGNEDHVPPPLVLPPLSPSTETKGRSREIVLIIVPIVVTVILFSFCWYLLKKRERKSNKTILRENFGHESTTVESLQFNLAVIKAATNNFSHENKIGKGGFGEVYKGVLLDKRHIAAKRLSRSSKQGAVEFKNEVLLIAKLQHRNLVAFIGFCLEEQEKILIYEYVQNKSLDYFLFDAHSEKLLSWSERYKIIEGVARGILYLHEYSRLKVIHRDLKPSNVLLDENMNPKISDFGLARIIEIDRQQGSTNRIVGTLGYIPPEYAMLGQFSEKSDVFSFGVMILETITGKKNLGSYESHGVADGLFLVWRQYRDQTPLNILDPKLRENCNEFEVTRCTHIGLLCVQEDPNDRPMMMVVVSYFGNHSIELPSPREPAFFLLHRMDRGIVAHGSSSNSINMMSTSNIFPRS